MASKQATSNGITLKGSVEIVTEFFGYSINSILFQRGVYPPDQFSTVPKYGLTMLITNDTALQDYLGNITKMIHNWLMVHALQKVVIVVSGVNTGETLERWAFDIEADKEITEATEAPPEKPQKEITKEIQAIMRQITASVTFLPMLDEPCAFEVLLYTDKDAKIDTSTWEESEAKFIANSEEMRLRSFSTKVHQVNTAVSYKVDDDF